MILYKKIRSKLGWFFSALIAQLLIMQNAYAQFAEPGADDMSRQFIGQIFGSLVGGGTDAFGKSIATFNGGILVVGGILVAYTILAGTLGTAHDGEMLGKKFSSVWVPIRTAVGTALILPVLPGGYCVMQGIVMWLVMQGAGLANLVWNNYMSSPPPLSGKVSIVAENKIRQFVEDVYLANVCVASLKQAVTDSPSYFNTYNYSIKEIVSPDGRKSWLFGDFGGVIPSPTLCGTVIAPKKPNIKVVSSTVATSVTSLSAIKASFQSPDLTGVYTAHMNNISNIINQTKTLAETAIKDKNSVKASQLDSLITAYKSSVESAAASAMSSTGVSEAAKTQGWFLAGTWATKIIFLQNKINTAVGSTGTANAKQVDMKDALSEEAVTYANNGKFVLAERRPELAAQLNSKSEKNKENSTASAQDLSIGGKVINTITSAITSVDFENIKNDDRHPIVLMNQIGDRLFTSIAWGMAGALALSIAGVKILGTGVELAPAYITVFGILGLPLAGLIGVAGMLAYIIPNMPFLLWLGIIIGWTLMVVEAVLAAPLWAVMHLHPNGEDMTGKGGNGYMLVLGLLLRPTLIIFGLIGAIVFSEIFGKLINIIFFDLFTSNTMDGEVGLFGVIFGTGLYASIMFVVIKNTFALMHQIPDQLMRWAGGGGEQLGQYANQMSEGAIAKGSAIAGGVAGAGLVKMGGALGGAAQQLKGLKDDSKRKKESNDQAAQTEDQAAQTESNSQSASNGETNNSLGSNSSDIINSSLAGAGGQASSSQLSSPQAYGMKSELSNANNALGGKDSQASTAFRENMASDIQNGATFEQAFSKNMPAALDQAYGAGAGRFADKATQGTFKGSEMAGVVSGMQNIQSLYSGVAGQESKQSTAINTATAHMKMGSSPSEAMNKVVDTIINKSSSANVGGFSGLNSGSTSPQPPPPKVED